MPVNFRIMPKNNSFSLCNKMESVDDLKRSNNEFKNGSFSNILAYWCIVYYVSMNP